MSVLEIRLTALLVSWGCCDKLPCGLEQQRFLLALLEASNLISRCWQGCAPARPVGRFSFLPPPESGGSRLSLACGCVTPVSASIFTWPPLPPVSSLLSLVIDTCHWFTAHPDNLGWFHLKVFNYICKDPIFQISSYAQVLGITTWASLLGGHHSAHYICL